MELKSYIREVPDFPKAGISFKDITTLWKDAEALRTAVAEMSQRYQGKRIAKVVGIEARGFVFGGIMACKLGCGFVPARKPGKLPAKTVREEYTLEYGSNALEIHADALSDGERVVIVDDLLATGGTALAVARLVEGLGAEIVGIEFLVELDQLRGREKLSAYPCHSHIHYE